MLQGAGGKPGDLYGYFRTDDPGGYPVIRSDILGFNAPIVQKDGNYAYEDRDYSIFNVTIQETDLLSRVLDFILEIQSEIQHPDMKARTQRTGLVSIKYD